MQHNADGQFPKKYDHTKLELYEKMGFKEEQMKPMLRKWNVLVGKGLETSFFLQQADMEFTKHELLLLFTLAHNQG
jgi:hypothetical protein